MRRRRLIVAAFSSVGIGVASLVLAQPVGATSTGSCTEAGTTTVVVTCTAGSGTWTPPTGVTSVTVDVEGGHGGSANAGVSPGGPGGKVTATLTVSSTNAYKILVGSQGSAGNNLGTPGTGGTNGGAAFYSASGGVGGASALLPAGEAPGLRSTWARLGWW